MADGIMIFIEPSVYSQLSYWVSKTRMEVSGFFWVRREGNKLIVYRAVLLDKGTEGYTEIPTEKIYALSKDPDKANMRGWWHRHPMGSGVPGPNNWSGRDTQTILTEPVGNPFPKTLKWSVSIVHTWGGWVGRVDNYLSQKSVHCPVYPLIEGLSDTVKAYEEVDRLYEARNIIEPKEIIGSLTHYQPRAQRYVPEAKQTIFQRLRSKFSIRGHVGGAVNYEIDQEYLPGDWRFNDLPIEEIDDAYYEQLAEELEYVDEDEDEAGDDFYDTYFPRKRRLKGGLE